MLQVRGEETRSQQLQRFWRTYGLYGVFLIIIIFFTINSPVFFTFANIMSVIRQSAINGIVAIGLFGCVVGGNVDLTVGSLLALSAALYGGIAKDFGVVVAVVVMMFIALISGLFFGYLSTRAKGLSIMMTLAGLWILYGATLIYTEGKPIIQIPTTLNFLGGGYIGPIPWPVVVFGVIALLMHFFLTRTVWGGHIYAMGSNREAARLAGINVNRLTILTFMISACLAAFGGIVLVGRVTVAHPTAGVGLEMTAIGAVLIGGATISGGAGSVIHTTIGVLILGIISNGLNLMGVAPYYQYVVKGVMVIFAIYMDQWGRR